MVAEMETFWSGDWEHIASIATARHAVMLFRLVTFLSSSGRCFVPHKWYPNISWVWYGLCHTWIYVQGRTFCGGEGGKLQVNPRQPTVLFLMYRQITATAEEKLRWYITFDRPQLGINGITKRFSKAIKAFGKSQIERESSQTELHFCTRWCHFTTLSPAKSHFLSLPNSFNTKFTVFGIK